MKELTKITASNLERAMLCAGSPRFENLVRLDRSEEADEGIIFDELLTSMVEGVTLERSSKGHIFTKEMHLHANKMLSFIPKGSVSQFDCSWVTEHSDIQMANRLDFYSIDEATNTLHITDTKYGYGIVEVVEKKRDGSTIVNWQLADYAIGVVLKLQRIFKFITFTIVQPRPHHEDGPVRSHTITYKELLEIKDQIEKRLAGMKNNNNTELVTGSHCTFCKAGDSFVCPAKNKSFNNSVQVVMTDLKQDYLTDEDISNLLDLYEDIKERFKIQEKSLKELAKNRIKANAIIPNWTNVDSFGHRKWNPSANIETIKLLTGLDPTAPPEMMSPSQFEGTYNVPEMLLNGLTHRPFNGTNLKRKNAGEIADKVFNNIKKEGK